MGKLHFFREKIKASVFFLIISVIGTIIIFDNLQAQEYTLKLGTLAPAGSSWFDKLSEFKNEVETKTNGKIKIVIYSGGVAGDEIEMVRKMQSGKIQGAALIIKGMKEIAPELDFLDIPFMFKNYDEVRKIYNRMEKEIAEIFEKNGYILLGMSHHGFVKFFSTKEISSFYDLAKMRTWAWYGEPTIKNFLEILGVKPVYAEVVGLLSSIENGMVEVFQTSPLSCLTLQWCKLVKYCLDENYRYEPGLVVLKKDFFNSLPPDMRNAILESANKKVKELNLEIEKIQAEAENKLRTMGIKFVKPKKEEVEEIKKKVREEMFKKVKNKELFQRFLKELGS